MDERKSAAIMGNWSIKLTSDRKWHFDYAMEMAIVQHGADDKGHVTHYAIDKNNHRFTLFWVKPTGIVKPNDTEQQVEVKALPYAMNAEQVSTLVWGWLQSADYDAYPDIDGSAAKGFTISTDHMGHALDNWAGAVSVETTWALIGK